MTFVLSNGVPVPRLGFGTWQIPEGEAAYDATAEALRLGYRHLDTARAYGNEASVGRAVRDSGIPREEVFVTTKLPAEVKSHALAVEAFEASAKALDLGWVDLYLIHAPWPWTEIGKDCTAGNVEVWKHMEDLYASGACRSIGVSNFNPKDLEALRSATDVTPHANQIAWFVGNPQRSTTAYCHDAGILVEGYSPLATGRILRNPEVQAVASKYGKTVAQLCIRYLLEHDVLPLPKSTTPSRIAENADVDWVIEAEDVAYLDRLRGTV
jgi:diketogulonate reductase-like aldo/keto reductase